MVRNILLSLLVTTALASSAFANHLSAQEEQAILLTLNNSCGDTWCEGPFDIQFLSLQHENPGFVLEAATTADPTDPRTELSISFRCEIPMEIVKNLISATDDDFLFAAEVELFSEVSRCVDTALYTKN